MSEKVFISVVVPVYKSKDILPFFIESLSNTMIQISQNYEVIFVDDGCPEDSWNVLQNLSKESIKIKTVKLSRNFGQNNAINAGLSFATGELIVVMDCDLQDKPSEILNFYKKILEGYELVVGKVKDRKIGFFRKLESKIFYKCFNLLTGIKASSGVGNFGIYSRNVIESYLQLNEENKSFGACIIWIGFSRYELEIESDKRFSGKSSYTLTKKIKLAVSTIISFSDRFLIIIISVGVFITFISFLFLILKLFSLWFYSKPLSGWTSLILSIYFSLGIIISSIGVVGFYIGKIFSQVKKRPNFIVSKKNNL